jgi:hypothetical protein
MFSVSPRHNSTNGWSCWQSGLLLPMVCYCQWLCTVDAVPSSKVTTVHFCAQSAVQCSHYGS